MCSLRLLGNDYVGNFCSDDFRVVAFVDPENDRITFEKGAYLASERELHIQTDYNYSNLVDQAISEIVKEEDLRTYLEKADLENIKARLRAHGLYEFTVFQKINGSDYTAVRHKFRYLPNRRDIILVTWEIMNQWAEVDELTDCLNEAGFYRTGEDVIFREIENEPLSLVYFNISDFKGWNTLLGKENADQLLKETATRLRHSGLSPLAIGRLFADNFVCLVHTKNINDDTLMRLCASEYTIEEHNLTVRMRCGIFRIENTHENIRRMCDKAKLAKMNIENEHAIPYREFDNHLNEEYMQHIQVLNNVGNALEKKQIKVYYQPIVDAKNGDIASAEALIRWQESENRIMAPSVFIPVLEEQGLISEVDGYALDTVVTMLKTRSEEKRHIVPVSVNMSRMDFVNTNYTEHLKELIDQGNLAHYLRMEVTESSYIEVGKAGQDLLKYLKDGQISVLMDDFGTGFSSLSGLTGRQFDIIKVDMSLVREIGKDNGAEAIIQAVINMCHSLNLKVVAEGVETEEHVRFLKEAGCDYLQGYYFYKPMPQSDFEELLNNGGKHE